MFNVGRAGQKELKKKKLNRKKEGRGLNNLDQILSC